MADAGRVPVFDHDSPATSGAQGVHLRRSDSGGPSRDVPRRPWRLAMSRLQAKTFDLMLALDDGLDILTAKAHAGRGPFD